MWSQGQLPALPPTGLKGKQWPDSGLRRAASEATQEHGCTKRRGPGRCTARGVLTFCLVPLPPTGAQQGDREDM